MSDNSSEYEHYRFNPFNFIQSRGHGLQLHPLDGVNFRAFMTKRALSVVKSFEPQNTPVNAKIPMFWKHLPFLNTVNVSKLPDEAQAQMYLSFNGTNELKYKHSWNIGKVKKDEEAENKNNVAEMMGISVDTLDLIIRYNDFDYEKALDLYYEKYEPDKLLTKQRRKARGRSKK